MKKVGLTGGIGSGKSTVAKVLRILGVPVYNSDKEAKRLMREDALLRLKIAETFGESIYDKENNLRRRELASIVFHDSYALKELNSLVHPVVKRDFDKWAQGFDTDYVVQESAVLIESGGYKDFDLVVSVLCPKQERIQRVLSRELNMSREQVEARMKMQTTDEERVKLSFEVLKNGKDDLFLLQIIALNNKIKELC